MDQECSPGAENWEDPKGKVGWSGQSKESGIRRSPGWRGWGMDRGCSPVGKTGIIPRESWAGKAWRGRMRNEGCENLWDGENGEIGIGNGPGMQPCGESRDDPKGRVGWEALDGHGTERGVQESPGWGKRGTNPLQTGMGALPKAWRCRSRALFPFSPRLRTPRGGSSFSHYCLLGLGMRSLSRSGRIPGASRSCETALGPCRGAPNGIRGEH